jgi:hypothetical protein
MIRILHGLCQSSPPDPGLWPNAQFVIARELRFACWARLEPHFEWTSGEISAATCHRQLRTVVSASPIERPISEEFHN